jgi:hypothetical protein
MTIDDHFEDETDPQEIALRTARNFFNGFVSKILKLIAGEKILHLICSHETDVFQVVSQSDVRDGNSVPCCVDGSIYV